MKNSQDDDLKMINTTCLLMIANSTTWGINPIIQAMIDAAQEKYTYSMEQFLIQKRGSADETLVKNEDRDELIVILTKVKSGEISYCNSVGDHTNFNFINKTKSNIKEMKDNELKIYAKNVHALAIELGVKLLPYNIVVLDVTHLKTKLDAFEDSTEATRLAIIAVGNATENIANAIHQVKTMFKTELDPLVETYYDVAPNFVKQYRAARKIIHYGVRHEGAEATINAMVIAKADQSVLYLVSIIVVETGDRALTDDNGAAVIDIAKAGVYTLTFEKPGYITITKTNVQLGVGDILALNVEMVAEV